jgi:hypothetical protein
MIRRLIPLIRAAYRMIQPSAHLSMIGKSTATLDTPKPDFNRLAGIEMWGGAGAVWESPLEESLADKKTFRETVIRIALTMERLGFGTDRSRFIASTVQSWLNKGP